MELKFFPEGTACFVSKKLGCKNGFFTRLGGSSLGDTRSLNLAFGRGDSRETVIDNLSLCAKSLGFAAENTVSCPQVHSCNILKVDRSHAGLGYFKESELAYDGYYTEESKIVLGVKTADCVPILFSGKKSGEVVSVGAAHAGWRGSVNGIAARMVEIFLENGFAPEEIFVAIGPCASACCYEVGEDVYSAAVLNFGRERADKYFVKNSREGKYMADLKGFNASVMHDMRIPYENMDICESCTVCEERFFYSHRRDGERRGTHLNVISF